MTTLQIPARNRKVRQQPKKAQPPAVSAERVKEMLQEITFLLHATRVVGRKKHGDVQ